MLKLLSAFCVLTLGACTPQANTLWIESGSTSEHLVFGLGVTQDGPAIDQFGVLRVSHCDGPKVGKGAVWVLSQVVEGPPPTAVVYAQVPVGYVSDQGPEPLSPGCYEAYATTGGQVRFFVDPGGAIRVVQ